MSLSNYSVSEKEFAGELDASRYFDSNPEITGVKYFDIDSTHRNRRIYANPCDFVMPVYSEEPTVASTFRDPVLLSFPYTGSLNPVGTPNVIQAYTVVGTQADVTLDPLESNIDNFYVNALLEIPDITESRRIISYNNVTKIARISPAFSVVPLVPSDYITRKDNSYFNSDVGIVGYNAGTNTVTSLNLLDTNPSPLKDFYKGSYFSFTNGPHVGEIANVTSYTPISALLAWEQTECDGMNEKLVVGQEKGFKFVPNPGYLYSVALYGHVFDDTNPTRSLKIRIREGQGLTGTIIYENTFAIPVNAGPNPISITLSGLGPYLYSLSYFTFTFEDMSLSTTGFINLFGIVPTSEFVCYNMSVFPTISMLAYADTPQVWEQPTANGASEFLSTSSQKGFAFSISQTGNIVAVTLNFNSVRCVVSR
jgi:hypothetical protein